MSRQQRTIFLSNTSPAAVQQAKALHESRDQRGNNNQNWQLRQQKKSMTAVVTGVNIRSSGQRVMLVEQSGINFRNRLEQNHYAPGGQLDKSKVYDDMTKIYYQMIAAADQSGAGALILTPLSNGYFAGNYKDVMQGNARNPGISYTAMFKAMEEYKKNYPQSQMQITTTVGDTLQAAQANDLQFIDSISIASHLQRQVRGQVAIGIAAHDNDGTGKLYDPKVQSDYAQGKLPPVQEEAVKLQTNFNSDALQVNTRILRAGVSQAVHAAQPRRPSSTAGQGGSGAYAQGAPAPTALSSAAAPTLDLLALLRGICPAITAVSTFQNQKPGELPVTVVQFNNQAAATVFAQKIHDDYGIKNEAGSVKAVGTNTVNSHPQMIFSQQQINGLTAALQSQVTATASAQSAASSNRPTNNQALLMSAFRVSGARDFRSVPHPKNPQQMNTFMVFSDQKCAENFAAWLQNKGIGSETRKDSHGNPAAKVAIIENGQYGLVFSPAQMQQLSWLASSVEAAKQQAAQPTPAQGYSTAGGFGGGAYAAQSGPQWASPQPAPGQLGNISPVFSAAAAARGASLQQFATQQPQVSYQSLAAQGTLSNYFNSNLGLPQFRHIEPSTGTRGDQVLVFNTLQEAQQFSRALLNIDPNTFCKQGQPWMEKGTSAEYKTKTGGQIIMTAAQMESLMDYCARAQNQQSSQQHYSREPG